MEQGFEKFSGIIGTQTAALLDLFPILRSLPDLVLPLRRYAKELHKKESELYVGHWLDVKKAIKEKTARPSFCVDLVRAQDAEGFSDPLAAYVSGSLLEAGSDTTSATLIGCMYSKLPWASRANHRSRSSNAPVPRRCQKGSRRTRPSVWRRIPDFGPRAQLALYSRLHKGKSALDADGHTRRAARCDPR